MTIAPLKNESEFELNLKFKKCKKFEFKRECNLHENYYFPRVQLIETNSAKIKFHY